jgi:hypothetical protein
VEVSGVISGSFSADDVFLVFPSRERAFRLAAYRERIAELNRVQIAGPPLSSCGFELDSSMLNSQEQVTRRFRETEEFTWQPGETPDLRKLASIYVPPDEEMGEESEEEDNVKKSPPRFEQRESWTEEAETGSARVLSRQAKRDLNRMRAREEQRRLGEKEMEVMEKIRAEIHGRESQSESTIRSSRPVVPVILKCDSENLFNGILDEFERLEEELEVKIPVVHGGVGNLNSQDVDHGIAERQFGFCPMYALNVGISTVAQNKADNENIPIYKFVLFTEVVQDVKNRVLHLKRRVDQANYNQELRRRAPRHVATESGM